MDDSVAETSFHQKNPLNLSQMFNYYTNQPLLDKGSRKTNKNLLNAYKSYTSSSVTKKANKSKSKYPSLILTAINNKSKFANL